MKLTHRLFSTRKIVLGAVSFLSLASIAAADAPYADANPFERSVFGDDWGVLSSDIFFGGAGAMFGLSPASRMLMLSTTSASKTSPDSNAIVDAASSSENLFNFASSLGSPFAIGARGPVSGGGGEGDAPNAPDAILASQTWDGGTLGNGTSWTSGANWVGDPSSGPGSTSTTTNTDIGTIVATGTNPAIGISGTTYFFGAIDFTSTANRAIGSSGTTAATLTLQLNGATVNGVANTILRASSTGTLTLQANIGQSTPNTLDLALGNTTNNIINIDSTGGITISSVIKNGTLAPNANLTLNATSTGILTFSGTAANTYSGLTAVNSGTLLLNKSAGINAIAGDVRIGNGTAGGTATVRLGASDQMSNTSDVELAGGTLNLNGFSEGSAAAAGAGVGALTLTANSTIDFGSGTSILHFTSLGAHTPATGPDLAITNWSGSLAGGGTDQLLFTGLGSTFEALYNDSDVSFNGVIGYDIIQFTGYYELVPVPEPSTWIGAALALAALGFTQRRRFRSLLAHRA